METGSDFRGGKKQMQVLKREEAREREKEGGKEQGKETTDREICEYCLD